MEPIELDEMPAGNEDNDDGPDGDNGEGSDLVVVLTTTSRVPQSFFPETSQCPSWKIKNIPPRNPFCTLTRNPNKHWC